MKKLFLSAAATIVLAGAMAQTKPVPKTPAKPAPKPAAKTTPAKPVTPAKPAFALKTGLDSLSYALGVLDGGFFKQQGIDKLNYTALLEAFKAVIEGKEPLMTPQMADQTLRQKLQEAAQKKIQPTIDEGLKFLAENKKRPEVKETPSGLQYEVVKAGTGPMPKDTNVVKVHYTGTLINGTKFDSSRDRGEPAQFPLNGVIPGWTEGVQLMPVGSVYKFYIPYQLAYGAQGMPPTIPGGSMLIFEVELLDIITGGGSQ
ncbi:FKBP-type peptidyl-prolyl cis-trans isomerase [Phnomibacter sp. MR]|uniref:FKBP-type peptidyl-prolyl cis-trans isomerase n=1 Tax=Phnomibacter sp. MR TaxID=3042318 RepID=UPI003A807C51